MNDAKIAIAVEELKQTTKAEERWRKLQRQHHARIGSLSKEEFFEYARITEEWLQARWET